MLYAGSMQKCHYESVIRGSVSRKTACCKWVRNAASIRVGIVSMLVLQGEAKHDQQVEGGF
jgi:hypothetical protein